MGLGENPPPQFGQTLPSTFSTQVAQKVHSNEQMRASSESGGSALPQFSQTGRSASASMTSKSSSVMLYLRRTSSFENGMGMSARLGSKGTYRCRAAHGASKLAARCPPSAGLLRLRLSLGQ